MTKTRGIQNSGTKQYYSWQYILRLILNIEVHNMSKISSKNLFGTIVNSHQLFLPRRSTFYDKNKD